MSVYMISGNLYTIKNVIRQKKRKRWHLPKVSVLVPAYNEETTIARTLISLHKSDYPVSKMEVIVINDGSTDNTKEVVKKFKKDHKGRFKIRLINRPNKGKASALNYALRRCAKGSLIMCLDSDSYLEKRALRYAVQHFKDRNTVALSSNVNIVEDGTVLTFVQKFEYIVCYQMKKGQAQLGVEYIVGGIGSMFRRSMLQEVSFYDNNTVTEDIDLTMKIILNKDKKQKIAYASDSIVYTEAAHSLGDLMNQRFRWKYGRTQTFMKNSALFFSNRVNHSRRLSWFMLPFTILQDIFFFFEPLVLGYFAYLSVRYMDTSIYISAFIVLTAYLLFNIWDADHLKFRDRLRLTFYAPPMYLLMYVLSFAEYFALIKSLVLSHKLKSSLKMRNRTWNSPVRKGAILQT